MPLLYLTGVDLDMWKALWGFPKASPTNVVSGASAATEAKGRVNFAGAGRKATLSLEDQLLLTLMRLRLGGHEQDLAYQFGVSVSTISRTVVMWQNYLYLRLGLVLIWPDWEDVESSMPSSFKESYPTTFTIIDATELRCEIPCSLSLQSQHYSSYKSHTTLKALVAVASNGSFIFISELFTGSISDRQIVEDSYMLPLLESVPAGKSIMADQGLEILDLLVQYDLLLNSPPLKGGKKSLSKKEVRKTQQIARLHIHIERAIGQVKERFHIFEQMIPLSLHGSMNQIWAVACLLTNFLGPIIVD